jgi:hypothetical protein
MSAFVSLLEEQAEHCVQAAYRARSSKAERFLRLLAVDLMLTARLHQPAEATPAAPQAVQPSAFPAALRGDSFDELSRLAASAARTMAPAPQAA